MYDPTFHLRVDCDEYAFHCVLMDFTPEIPGSYSYTASSDWEHDGYPMEFEWECVTMDVYNEDGLEIEGVAPDKELVEKYSKEIDEAFLKALQDYDKGDY